MKFNLFALISLAVLSACSKADDHVIEKEPPQAAAPVIEQPRETPQAAPAHEVPKTPPVGIELGRQLLTSVYDDKVKPEDPGASTQCASALVDGRAIVRCGVSYAGQPLTQLGFWEIAQVSGRTMLYAMNGKALLALEKIGTYGNFQPGQNRPPLDLEKADAAMK